MEENVVSKMLMIVLIVMIIILMVLSVIYLVLRLKSSSKAKAKKTNKGEKDRKTKKDNVASIYNKQSIFDFMEFDSIEDNMIVQKNGKRYIMIVECQGVNYDLMSQMEKTAVEEGFQQFLNTLRHPIQIYIQTRTINLEGSVNRYKDRVKEIEDHYQKMIYDYQRMKETESYSPEQLEKYFYEITKQRNLLEYGKDVVANTEKMSLNKNVLNKKYYIVIPYYSEEVNDEKYAKEEIRNMAFSELYTKAQSIIRTLSACSIIGKILNSTEVVELLYMAYNRDDAEVFGIERALKSEYDSLYSTAPDVFEKKLKFLEQQIQEKAQEKANQAIEKVKSRPQELAEEKENNMEELVRNLAELILHENRQNLGGLAEEAIQEIEKERKEENQNEEQEKTTTRRGREKSIQ